MGGRFLSHLNSIYLMSFLDTFSIGILIPLLAPYLRSLGASHLVIGLSSSLYGIAQLVSSPLVGSWSDNNGRLSVLSISLIVCSVCYLLIGVIQSVHLILLLRFIIGCFKHTQSLCKAFIADEVSSDCQTSVYGTLYAVSSIGFVLGPAIGGHLSEITNDITYVTVAIMTCFWFNIALARTLPHHHIKKQIRDSHDKSNNAFNVLTHLHNINWKAYRNILILKLCFVYCTSLYYNNFSLTLKEKYALSTTTVGYIISFQALIQSLSAYLLGKIEKLHLHVGSIKTIIGQCFIILTVAFTGLFQTSSVSMLLIWLVPFSICQAVLRSLLLELLVENASPEERGSLLGTSQSISGLGRLSAPVIAGIATDQLNTSAVPLITMGIAATGALLSFLLN